MTGLARLDRVLQSRGGLSSLIAFAIIVGLGIRIVGEQADDTIRFEAESIDIRAPFRTLQNPAASGGRSVRPETAIRGENVSAALDYPVEIRKEGAYVIWARALWLNGCANSAMISLIQGDHAVFSSFIGHDALYGRWHWVRAKAPAPLEPGSYTFRLSVAEWSVNLDSFILTRDEFFDPEKGPAPESGAPPVDIKSGWITGRNTTLTQGADLTLAGPANPMILNPDRSFGENLRFTARLCGGDPHPTLIRLFLDASDLRHLRAIEIGDGRCRFLSETEGRMTVLCEGATPVNWADGMPHDVVVERGLGQITVFVDGRLALNGSSPPTQPGKIGLGASAGTLRVLDLHCEEAAPCAFGSNFDVDRFPLTEAQGWTPVSGTWERTEWRAYPEVYQVWGVGPLVSEGGDEGWSDYLVGSALSLTVKGEAGLILRSRPGNRRIEVLARPSIAGRQGTIRLLTRDGAQTREVAAAPIELLPDEWFLLEAEARGTQARVWVDGALCLQGSIGTGSGKIGLYAIGDSVRTRKSFLTPILFPPASPEGREFEVPLKVTTQSAEIGTYFNVSDESLHLFRIVYPDPQHARVELVRLELSREGSTPSRKILVSREFDLASFIDGRKIAVPPPQLEVTFALNITPSVTRAAILNPLHHIDLPPDSTAADPTAEVGIYDPTALPVARFDDVEVTGLPFEIAHTEPDTVVYDFNTNYHAARDLASWKFTQGSWNLGPVSFKNLISTECLVGVVQQQAAVAASKRQFDGSGIEFESYAFLPIPSRAIVGLELSGSGGRSVRFLLLTDPSNPDERFYHVIDQDRIVAVGVVDATILVPRLGIRMGPEGLTASLNGRPVAGDPSVVFTAPFRVRLIVEGPPDSRGHFDEVTVMRTAPISAGD